MVTLNIVLAHGVLGFGDFAFARPKVNYFNGIAPHFVAGGHHVAAPQVNPIGSIAQRAEQLALAISRAAGTHGSQVHVIAHSMGGLDARHALTHIAGTAAMVKTLVTIGTPHRGSPVADAILNRADPLRPFIPHLLVDQLESNAGALHDLTTDFGKHFDETTPDVEGVRYIEVAGDASHGSHELLLFQIASIIGRLRGQPNDGVVTRDSALRPGHEHLPDWPVDHAGEIGWTLDAVLDPLSLVSGAHSAHLQRYDTLLTLLAR